MERNLVEKRNKKLSKSLLSKSITQLTLKSKDSDIVSHHSSDAMSNMGETDSLYKDSTDLSENEIFKKWLDSQFSASISQLYLKPPCCMDLKDTYGLEEKDCLLLHEMYRQHLYTPVETTDILFKWQKEHQNKIKTGKVPSTEIFDKRYRAFFALFPLKGTLLYQCLKNMPNKLDFNKETQDLLSMLKPMAAEYVVQNDTYDNPNDVETILTSLIVLNTHMGLVVNSKELPSKRKFVEEINKTIGHTRFSSHLSYYYSKMIKNRLVKHFFNIKRLPENFHSYFDLTSNEIFFFGMMSFSQRELTGYYSESGAKDGEYKPALQHQATVAIFKTHIGIFESIDTNKLSKKILYDQDSLKESAKNIIQSRDRMISRISLVNSQIITDQIDKLKLRIITFIHNKKMEYSFRLKKKNNFSPVASDGKRAVISDLFYMVKLIKFLAAVSTMAPEKDLLINLTQEIKKISNTSKTNDLYSLSGSSINRDSSSQVHDIDDIVKKISQNLRHEQVDVCCTHKHEIDYKKKVFIETSTKMYEMFDILVNCESNFTANNNSNTLNCRSQDTIDKKSKSVKPKIRGLVSGSMPAKNADVRINDSISFLKTEISGEMQKYSKYAESLSIMDYPYPIVSQSVENLRQSTHIKNS